MALAQATISSRPEAKASENLLSSFMTFNQPHTWTISDGVGNVEVSNSTTRPLYGKRSFKVKYLTSSEATIISGADETESTVAIAGQHCLSWQIYKDDISASVNFTVQFFVNDVLIDARTFVSDAYVSGGFVDGKVNTFYQWLNLDANDRVAVAFLTQCDTVDTIIYVDGFKLELNDKSLNGPTFYTEPFYLTPKWQTRTDFTNTQNLEEDTETALGFTGTVLANFDGNLVDASGFIIPSVADAVMNIDYSFVAVVPAGSGNQIDVALKIDSVVYRGNTHSLVKDVAAEQTISGSFCVPVSPTFKAESGQLFLTSNIDCVIKKRIISVVEHSNY